MAHLLAQIEDLRSQMIALAKELTLCDPRVVMISQKLDKLLNQYYALSASQK